MKLPLTHILLVALVLAAGLPVHVAAQQSAGEIIEQARARSQDIEELKKILNGPDQNMRLTTFDAMVNGDDQVVRDVALDIGMASADSLLQGLALKALVMGLDRVHLTLTSDESAPKNVQENSAKYIEEKGGDLVIPLSKKDPQSGIAQIDHPSHTLQVSGTLVSFKWGNSTGTLDLQDDNSIKGVVRGSYRNKPTQFIAVGRIR